MQTHPLFVLIVESFALVQGETQKVPSRIKTTGHNAEPQISDCRFVAVEPRPSKVPETTRDVIDFM